MQIEDSIIIESESAIRVLGARERIRDEITEIQTTREIIYSLALTYK